MIQQQLKSPKSFRPALAPLLLQRKCSCGSHTPASGECADCAKKKIQKKLRVGAVNDPLEIEAERVADQVMRAPLTNNTPVRLQRSSTSLLGPEADVPDSVHRTLSSPGQLLDHSLNADMSHRFGHNFSHVRVHQDAVTQQSASDVNARAYTVGNNVVFGAGEYAPSSEAGRRLIAHELAHVVQQGNGKASLQRHPAIVGMDEAGPNADLTGKNDMAKMQAIAAAKDKNELDERAKKIISDAKDTTKSLDQRAIKAVWDIVKTYYDSSKVQEVVYVEATDGLITSPVGTDKNIKGKITVGKYFIEHIDSFARRVLQVGHELQHVDQQRAGMGGGAKRNEREFLAHHWASVQDEQPGTGRMPHSTRVAMIDEALRNYYCMPEERRTAHKAKKDELLTLRTTEQAASGNAQTAPPASCSQ